MKATQGTTYRTLGSRLDDVAKQLEELRKIGASGKKLNKPSDDPSAIRPVLNTRKQLSNVDRYTETMGKAIDTMQATDGHLEHVENIMQRAKEIMTNAINGSLNAEDRTTLADELSQIRKELLDAANASIDGKYLFAGYKEDTVPFIENPAYAADHPDHKPYASDDPTTWPYLYQGDKNATALAIGSNEEIEVNLTGSDLFFGASAWDPANPGSQQPDAGRYNIFTELTLAEEAIRTGETTAMQGSLDRLEGAANQNRRLRSQLGNRASRVETAMNHQEEVRIDLKQILSRYEDADAIEAFNNIVQQETAFQAALSVTSKVSQLSILDFL